MPKSKKIYKACRSKNFFKCKVFPNEKNISQFNEEARVKTSERKKIQRSRELEQQETAVREF
jgi:hypothetical protein